MDARAKVAQLSSIIRDNAVLQARYQQQITQLKQRVDEFERMQKREGADLLYLKNIVLKYMSDNTEANHQHLKPVLKMLLQFSEEEEKKMEQQRSGGAGWFSIFSPQKK